MATGRNSIQDLAELMFGRKAVIEVIGQVVYESNATFTVPAGVTSISMVCVGDASVTVSGTVVCRSNGAPVGTGGNGGSGGGDGGGSSGGGGGAGGYSGNGGTGGLGSSGLGGNGSIGNGGGGGGAGGGGHGNPANAGGGVGLKGQGASGTSATSDRPGDPGSGGVGKKYGGGLGGPTYNPGTGGTAGANLRYTNNVAVTPGQSVTVAVSNGTWDSGVRIMWGGGRSYPFNAGDIFSFRYLRIWITANNGDALTAIRELELRATPGGPDLTTPETPCYASSMHPAGHYPSYLVDSALNAWITNGTALPAWVVIDLGVQSRLEEIAMQCEFDFTARMPRDFIVQGSNDNVTYQDFRGFSGQTGWTLNQIRLFSLL